MVICITSLAIHDAAILKSQFHSPPLFFPFPPFPCCPSPASLLPLPFLSGPSLSLFLLNFPTPLSLNFPTPYPFLPISLPFLSFPPTSFLSLTPPVPFPTTIPFLLFITSPSTLPSHSSICSLLSIPHSSLRHLHSSVL